MKKVGEWIAVLAVLIVFIALACTLSFTGVKNGGYNYVLLEVNPKVEFVTNNNYIVETAFPINEEAKELLVGEKFIGLSISDATKKYLDLCTMLNYLDVERDDNAIKLTVVSGLTQSLELKLYRIINNYFTKNEIMSVIVENNSDLQTFKQSKKLGVSAGKFALIKSVLNLYPETTEKEIKNKSEKYLIEKIKTAHANLEYGVENYDENELANKARLIDFNRVKLERHNEKITNKTQSEFKEKYVKHIKKNLRSYEQNFEQKYINWKENRINNYFA